MASPFGALLFDSRKDPDGEVLYERSLQPWLFIICSLGFIAAAIYYKNVNYLFGWLFIFGLDVLLEITIIYFFKKDIERKGKQVLESGSFWKGTKQYKGDIDYLTYNAPDNKI